MENGAAPESILAQSTTAGVTRTCPLCPYPQTAIYRGSGSTDDANNFFCGGDLDKREVVCNGVLVKYKHEVNGPLDYDEGEIERRVCTGRGHAHGHDD